MTDLAAAWRGERIALSSSMPIEVARRWVSGDAASAGGDVVRRTAARLNTRSAWRPVLRGRLVAAGTGCRFAGVLGWDPKLRALTCCLLGASVAALGTGTVLAVTAASGRWAASGAAALGLFGVVVALVSTVVGYRETRGQRDYLRSWITGRMNAPWYRAGPDRAQN
ncbi:hypothetical protein ACQP2F_33735 [Actinoplanes sp. CA-030573]|uniref:hypothetical protein n=1 Tax=Actinoplanes sp. CA-030573 TaxID=3239898 RepID=UPI003D9164F8